MPHLFCRPRFHYAKLFGYLDSTFSLTVCDPNSPSGFKRGSDPSHQPGSHVLHSVAQVQCETSPRWFSCCSKSFQDTFQVGITPLLIKLSHLCAGFQAARARRLPMKLNPWSSPLLSGLTIILRNRGNFNEIERNLQVDHPTKAEYCFPTAL